MSFIQVPIGKGITKFPKIKQSIPEFTKESLQSPTSQNDFAFLRDIIENGRFVNQRMVSDSAQEVIAVTPATGDTFYYLGCSVINTHATISIRLSLVPDGTANRQDDLLVPAQDTRSFSIPIQRLVGNGTTSFTITQQTDENGTITNLWGYLVNTERIP